MPPASRVGDMHVCPMVDGVKPHVGGPVLPAGCPTVLIGNQPAARQGDMATCAGPPDAIAMGSPTVLIGNMMAARIGDPTVHGGVIVQGFPTVMIGIPGAGSPISPSVGPAVLDALADARGGGGKGGPPASAQVAALTEAGEEGAPLVEECPFQKHGAGD